MSVQVPALLELADLALLLMRLLVGAVFVTSGWSHVRDPVARGKSIGVSPAFTRRSASPRWRVAWASLSVG